MGRLDPDLLLEELTPDLWDEWLAFMEIEPVGFPAQNELHAELACTIARVLGGNKTIKPVDFSRQRRPIELQPSSDPTARTLEQMLGVKARRETVQVSAPAVRMPDHG